MLPSQEEEDEDNEPSKDNERSYVKQVLLLYLNQGMFEYHGEELTSILKYAIDQGFPIIMMHERDPSRNGCDFDVFFHDSPMELPTRGAISDL